MVRRDGTILQGWELSTRLLTPNFKSISMQLCKFYISKYRQKLMLIA